MDSKAHGFLKTLKQGSQQRLNGDAKSQKNEATVFDMN